MRPKWSLSGKTSACLGRLAPPESTESGAEHNNFGWKLNIYWKHPDSGKVRDISLLMVNRGLNVWNEDLVKPRTLNFPLQQTGWQNNVKYFFLAGSGRPFPWGAHPDKCRAGGSAGLFPVHGGASSQWWGSMFHLWLWHHWQQQHTRHYFER